MKTTKIQFNATSFKATRNTIGAYFGAKFELSVELTKVKEATANLVKVIASDKEQLMRLAMGDSDGIVRTAEVIRTSLKTNVDSYNAMIKPYNAMVEKVSDAVNKAIALFNDKDSALYKAYVTYAENPTDENYDTYAKAMSDRFVALGLSDATPDNVAHFMPNVDREVKGKSAVKKGDIQGAVNANAFAQAVLRKIYVQNRNEFSSKKFTDYVRKCAEKAKASK